MENNDQLMTIEKVVKVIPEGSSGRCGSVARCGSHVSEVTED